MSKEENTFTRAERRKIKVVEDYLKERLESFQEFYIKNTDSRPDGIVYEMDADAIAVHLNESLNSWVHYCNIWNKRPEKKRLIVPKRDRLEELIDQYLENFAKKHWYTCFEDFYNEYNLFDLGYTGIHIHNYYNKYKGSTCKEIAVMMLNDAIGNEFTYYSPNAEVISKYNFFRGVLRQFRILWALYTYKRNKAMYGASTIPNGRISIGYGIVNDIGEFRFPLPDRIILKEYSNCLLWKDYINTLEIHTKKEDK